MSFQGTLMAFIVMTLTFAACGRSAGTSRMDQSYPAKFNNSSGQPANLTSQDPSSLCNRIPEIKVMPVKGERGEDPVYDAFIDAGDGVVPCLIERVTDATEIRDPRPEPGFADIQVKIGDIAYFLLVDITKLHFTELLPREIQQEYKDVGVYAYFDFVRQPANREKLQDELRKWYEKKYGKSLKSAKG
jgi:hypothetical protein